MYCVLKYLFRCFFLVFKMLIHILVHDQALAQLNAIEKVVISVHVNDDLL